MQQTVASTGQLRMLAIRLSQIVAAYLFVLGTTGCVRRDGRNSECEWPGETVHHATSPRHLSADAEFAEDLAIRYADAHYGMGTPGYVSGEVYVVARDRCMADLFDQVARQHNVTSAQVSSLLGRNRGYIDLAEQLPFLLVSGFAAGIIARLTWRRYSPEEHGWSVGIVMVSFRGVAFAIGATMVGEVWSGLIESYRIGNDHMSYRAQRLLWGQHRIELFATALILFCLVAAEAARHIRSNFPREE